MKKLLTTLMLFLPGLILLGQIEIPYLGYNHAPTIYNPASSANTGSFMGHLSYQDYWVGFQDSPEALNLNLFGNINENMGLGINVNRTSIHIFNQTLLDASYAYRVQPHSDAWLSFGLSLGIRRLNAVQSNNAMDEYEPVLDGIFFDETLYTTGFGISYQWKGLSLDLAAPDVYRDAEFFEKYMAVLAYQFAISPDISMRPMAMYRKFSPVAEDYQFRLETGFMDLVFLELGYGNDVNVIAGLGFAFGGFKIGYYYSSLNTYLSNVSSGSNSIWLRYQLFDPLKTESAEE